MTNLFFEVGSCCRKQTRGCPCVRLCSSSANALLRYFMSVGFFQQYTRKKFHKQFDEWAINCKRRPCKMNQYKLHFCYSLWQPQLHHCHNPRFSGDHLPALSLELSTPLSGLSAQSGACLEHRGLHLANFAIQDARKNRGQEETRFYGWHWQDWTWSRGQKTLVCQYYSNCLASLIE